MAVSKIVLVPRLHRDFEETVVTVAVLQAFQKLGYDHPSQDQALAVHWGRRFCRATRRWGVANLCVTLLRISTTVFD